MLDCRILDRIIQNKWNGKYDINASFADYSTGFTMLKDQHNIFISDLVFQEISYEMFTLSRGHTVHNFKFEVWKHSMQLRAMMDLTFQLFVTFYFQSGLINFSTYKIESLGIGYEFLVLDREADPDLYYADMRIL